MLMIVKDPRQRGRARHDGAYGPPDGGDVSRNQKTLGNPERQQASVAYIITRAAEIHPDRIAIDDQLSARKVTYKQLEQEINRTARVLTELGLVKGDLLATMFPNDLDAVVILFAAAKVGVVVCPVNVRLLPQEVAAYLEPHGVRGVACSSVFCERFSGVPAEIRLAFGSAPQDGWVDANSAKRTVSDAGLAPVTSMDDPFRMIPTGGTTGVSKGVVHSHGGTLMTVLTNIAEFGIRRGWKTVLVAPAYHGAGMDWGLFPILWRGGTVIMPPGASFDPATYFRLLREHAVEYALLVPATIGPLYRTWDRDPVTTVKTLISTSAPTSPALRENLAEMFPTTDLLAGAGISESLNMAIQSPGDFLEQPEGIGEPHLDTRLCIVDLDGRELPRGLRGEICLRGFNTALYYHGNEDASHRVWRKRAEDPEGVEWCFTGDIGVMDASGRVSIVDRSKDIILTGGETVPSVEIENAFTGHAHIRECAAVGLPDERWGEAITLVVVKRSAEIDSAMLAKTLFSFGRARLAGYKLPKQIAFIDALPRSHFGKLLKRQLREMSYSELHRPETETSPSSSSGAT